MRQEDRLNIQAWLDGEIAPQKAAKIAEKVEINAKAKAVAEELKAVESALKIGEKAVFSDDSREFYWAQIERQINAEEPMSVVEEQPKLVPAGISNLMRWLVPIASLAAIFTLIINFNSISFKGSVQSIDEKPRLSPSGGKTELDRIFEDEYLESSVGVFNFEGGQGSRNFPTPDDPNALPESIENPEH